MHRIFLGLLLLVPILAGCLGDGRDKGSQTGEPLMDQSPIPAIDWDVSASVDWWEDFSTRWVKRDANTPWNHEALTYLAQELERIGLETEIRQYAVTPNDVSPPDAVPVYYYALVGTKMGTELPDQRIGLVSHYDTQALTLQGAYDDASGVATEFSICEALSKVEMRRTLACIFFDAEERGLVASDKYVMDVVLEGDEDYVYDFILGYDMTGINWPGHDWKMYVMTGGAEHVPALQPFAQDVMHNQLGYPEDGVEVLDTHDRNSDERRFREVDIPIYRFAGGRHANDYPEYHKPGDTVDYVYEFVGGRQNFEAGFATIVEGSYALALNLDRTDMDAMRAQYTG